MKLVELGVKYQTTTKSRVYDIYITSAFNRWWLHKLQFGGIKKDKMNQQLSESSHTHPDIYTVSIASPCFPPPKNADDSTIPSLPWMVVKKRCQDTVMS